MLYQTGFRPSGSALGARVIPIAPAFPPFIQSFPTPMMVTPPTAVYPIGAVTEPGPVVVVPAPAPSEPSYAPVLTWLVVGGIAITGAALLISALSPKKG